LVSKRRQKIELRCLCAKLAQAAAKGGGARGGPLGGRGGDGALVAELFGGWVKGRARIQETPILLRLVLFYFGEERRRGRAFSFLFIFLVLLQSSQLLLGGQSPARCPTANNLSAFPRTHAHWPQVVCEDTAKRRRFEAETAAGRKAAFV